MACPKELVPVLSVAHAQNPGSVEVVAALPEADLPKRCLSVLLQRLHDGADQRSDTMADSPDLAAGDVVV
jgi:hypothetical protein